MKNRAWQLRHPLTATMRALVTGACGFVGKHLINHLIAQGDDVLGTGLGLQEGSLPCPVAEFDVTDSMRSVDIVKSFNPEVIYHLAGIAFVPQAEENFSQALLVNVGGTSSIYSLCAMLQLPVTIILISSAEVYGRITPEDLPLTEETAIVPNNNYSLSKAMAELVVRRYSNVDTIRSVIMRPFNHIGPGQNDRFVASSFARQLACVKAGKTEPVISVGNLDARRDFSDVRDVVRAYRLAAEKGEGIYQTSSGRSCSIQEILDTLIEISGLSVEVKRDPARMRPSLVPEIRGTYDRARAELDWEPEIDLRTSLQDVYDYWLSLESTT